MPKQRSVLAMAWDHHSSFNAREPASQLMRELKAAESDPVSATSTVPASGWFSIGISCR
jgi:hypothetical protein